MEDRMRASRWHAAVRKTAETSAAFDANARHVN